LKYSFESRAAGSAEHSLFPPVASALALADAARRRVLLLIGHRARTILVFREYRVAFLGLAGIAFALSGSLFFPVALLAIGPILFGVPHLVADARYAIVRPGFHRQREFWISICILVGGLMAGWGVRAGLLAAACAAMATEAPWKRRAIIASVAFGLAAIAHRSPFHADVVFAHAHNVIAVGLWLAWRKRHTWMHTLVAVAFLSVSMLLFFGPLPGIAPRWAGLTFANFTRGLSWSSNSAVALRFALFFAFAQSVHYLVWLRLIPEEDRPSPTPRSYRQSARALLRDMGAWPLVLALVVGIALVVVAFAARISLSRDLYLKIAFAHGHIELIAAALFAAHGFLPVAGEGAQRYTPEGARRIGER